MKIENTNPKTTVTNFIKHFDEADLDKMHSLLANDLKSYITNAQGGVNFLEGRDAFMQNIQALDIKTVKPNVHITQILSVKQNEIMVMVEIKAQRKGQSLHNFATFLMGFKDDLIATIHMVEAQPAHSDEFWKA